MKKKISWVIAVSLFLIIIGAIGTCGVNLLLNSNFALNANWKMDFPKLLKRIDVASNFGGFPADGLEYTIYQYEKDNFEMIRKMNIWKDYETDIEGKVDTFLLELKKNESLSKEDRNSLEKYKPSFGHKNQYCYRTKDDNDYLIIFRDDEKLSLYVFESYF